MSVAACCWRTSLRASRWSRIPNTTPYAHRRLYADLADESYKRYETLPGDLQLQHLTDGHDEHLCANGIEGLYTPTGFQFAYTDWQSYMLTELNKRAKDFTQSTHSPEDVCRKIIKQTAKRQDEQAALFNFASMAWNNVFYFQGLRYGIPELEQPKEIPRNLQEIIERDFFSLENLKKEFLAHAKAMFAPGFVWLIIDNNLAQNVHGGSRPQTERRLGILCTYGAGSPLSEAHFRHQLNAKLLKFDSSQGARDSARNIAQHATLECEPLLCVSTWQHSYIPDWEVHGKARFLEAWWDRINWSLAASKAAIKPQRR